MTAPLGGNPAVSGISGGVYGDITIGGREVPAIGIDLLVGSVFPTLIDGRPPRDPDEIVLGIKVLGRLHRSVGDIVDVQIGGAGGTPRPMRVVGRSVFPKLGRGGFPPTALGDGAAVMGRVLAGPSSAVPPGQYNFFLVRYSGRRVDRVARNRLAGDLAGFGHQCVTAVCLRGAQRPGQVSGYAEVKSTPIVLAGHLAALALATLAHTLVTSIRRRRRDLAILKTLGFLRRQVSAAVAWQSTTITAIALVLGLPLGIVAGRWLWRLFAAQLGVATATEVPAVAVAVAVPAAIVAAIIIAVLPSRMAARTRPALVLRSE
ncbi:MAG: FtsX-like permease family protein [Acidimicrobiales bacterium]